MQQLLTLMADGRWRSAAELVAAVGGHWPSINARLRALRTPQYGGHRIIRRYRGYEAQRRVWEYALCRCGRAECDHESGAPTFPFTP